MDGNNGIFFAVDGALGYLAGPMNQKIFHVIYWGAIHLVRACGSYDRFFYRPPSPPSVLERTFTYLD